MDERFTIKKQYPSKYSELIRAPLLKTIFRTVDNKAGFAEVFSVDASIGLISFPRFAKKDGEIQNVIETILKNN